MTRLAAAALLLGLLLCRIPVLNAQEDVEDASSGEEEYEEPVERGFLIVRKKIFEPDVILGKNVTVVISVHNAGNSAALDVSVDDPSWPEEYFSHSHGEAKASYPRIAAGATVEFKYGVSPLSGVGQGQFYGKPAVVQYRPEADSQDVQLAFSTTPIFFIMSKWQTYIRTLLTLGSYATAGALTHPSHWLRFSYIVGGLAAALGGTWLFTALRDARKRQRYQRAYAEVQKYE